MKTLHRIAACALIALLCRGIAFSQPATSTNANGAWTELQQATALPGQQHTDKEVGATALAASEKAKAFYTQFPDSTNALAAKILECRMLQTAYYHGEHVFGQWDGAEANLAPNPGLSASERFDLRLPVIRELIKRFPNKEKPYVLLFDLAAISPDTQARPIANEILTEPVSDSLKDQAKALLRRLDYTGKPIDINFTAMDGRKVDLSQMKGKVVLIDFWSITCVPCVAEIPRLKKLYAQHHSHGFDIIGISSDTDKKAFTRFIQTHDLPWPQYFNSQDRKNKFTTAFVIENLPTLWLVDKKGILRETDANDDLQAKIEKLLAE